MATILKEDFIESIRDGFQFISYYHPADFIRSMATAYRKEKSPAAKNAIGQILRNSKMAGAGHRPICQDTGLATIFIKIGMNVQWDTDQTLEEMINEGVRRAYLDPENPLRASIVSDPIGTRKNTGDNTPAVIHTRLVKGNQVEVHLAAKGFGSENKSKLLMLNPNDDVETAVIKQIEEMGAGWCPPGMLGIGIGGSAEKAMLLAKESLLDPIDIQEIQKKGPSDNIEALRLSLYKKINALGIGAQGLGGLTTVLDVKVKEYPTHAGALPVGIIPNCAATRHVHFTLDGSGKASFTPPDLDEWPDIDLTGSDAIKRVNLQDLNKKNIKAFKAGETIYISGKMLTGRDAAHKRMVDTLNQGKSLPVNLDGKFIYYVGPVPKVGDEIIGSAGPTTSNRMDKFTDTILTKTGILGMIGKAERGPETIQKLKEHGAVYLIAVGGAAYLISKSIQSAKVIAYEDLGMEAIYEFEVKDMPVIVAVDTKGNSIHTSGPAYWKQQIINQS